VLVSHATEQLVQGTLPSGLDLVDLGEHRLRDLSRPEPIFQLETPGYPTPLCWGCRAREEGDIWDAIGRSGPARWAVAGPHGMSSPWMYRLTKFSPASVTSYL
jgi:hypothetical protein